jgi:hypothetical protein
MIKLHFDIRDLFRVIRLGWSGKKIWTGLCGLLIAYVGYSLLVTIGFAVTGTTVGEVWHRYGLFPGASLGSLPLTGTLLHLLAMAFAAAVFYLTSCMMCKITYQQLRGDDFYSSGDAWKFVKEHWGGALFGPVAVLVLFAVFVVTGVIIGWLAGVIPYLGEVGFALAFIPLFFAALIAVFIVAALVASLLFTPAIVGTVGEDTLEVLIQSFSLCWSQPWRLLAYTMWMVVSVWIGAVLLSGMMTFALGLMTWALGFGMGDKLTSMMLIAQSYLPPIDFTTLFRNMAEDMDSPWATGSGSRTGSLLWSGRILAAMLILLSGVFLAYVQAACASGSSLIYVILRKKKDDENMLEWEDPDMDDLDFSNFDDKDDDTAAGDEAEGDSSEGEASNDGDSDEDSGDGGLGGEGDSSEKN